MNKVVNVPTLLLLVIVIASFAPPLLRGITILICSGLAIWWSIAHYTPWESTPEIADEENPPVVEADELITRHSVEQTPKNQKIEK